MTEPAAEPSLVERAADDLLLLIERTAAGLPDVSTQVVAQRLAEAFTPAVAEWVGAHPDQAAGALAVAALLSQAAAEFSAAQFSLTVRVVAWCADRTDLSPADVLASVMASTEG